MIEVKKEEVYIDGMYYQYTILEFFYQGKRIYEVHTEQDSEENIERIKTQLMRDINIRTLL